METVETLTIIVCTKERHMTMTRTKRTWKTDHAMRGLNILGDRHYDYKERVKRRRC